MNLFPESHRKTRIPQTEAFSREQERGQGDKEAWKAFKTWQ